MCVCGFIDCILNFVSFKYHFSIHMRSLGCHLLCLLLINSNNNYFNNTIDCTSSLFFCFYLLLHKHTTALSPENEKNVFTELLNAKQFILSVPICAI